MQLIKLSSPDPSHQQEVHSGYYSRRRSSNSRSQASSPSATCGLYR